MPRLDVSVLLKPTSTQSTGANESRLKRSKSRKSKEAKRKRTPDRNARTQERKRGLSKKKSAEIGWLADKNIPKKSLIKASLTYHLGLVKTCSTQTRTNHLKLACKQKQD